MEQENPRQKQKQDSKVTKPPEQRPASEPPRAKDPLGFIRECLEKGHPVEVRINGHVYHLDPPNPQPNQK